MVIDSIDTLKKHVKKSGNNYFVMRHGGTEGNLKELVSYKDQENDNLTREGEAQVRQSAEKLKDSKIDLIIYSPFVRTTETASIVREVLGLDKDQMISDQRLIEVAPGEFDGKNWNEYHEHLYNMEHGWFERKIPGGESLQDVTERTGAVLYDLEAKYSDKNILIITHGGPARTLTTFVVSNTDDHEFEVPQERLFETLAPMATGKSTKQIMDAILNGTKTGLLTVAKQIPI